MNRSKGAGVEKRDNQTEIFLTFRCLKMSQNSATNSKMAGNSNLNRSKGTGVEKRDNQTEIFFII